GLPGRAGAARRGGPSPPRRHHWGAGDGVRRPAEPIAARAPPRAFDEPGPAQLEEELLQIGERNLLALGNRRQGQRTLGAVPGKIGHGGNPVPTPRVQLHGACLQSTPYPTRPRCTSAWYPCSC